MESKSKKIEYRISPVIQKIIQKIETSSLNLSKFGEVVQGITPYDSYRGHSKETIKNRVFHSDHKLDHTYGKWLDGKHVERYVQKWGGEWISYGEWLAAPRESKYFEGNRILFREIPGANKRIQACAVREVFYHGHSISPFKPFDGQVDKIPFITGCSNSRLVSFYGQKTLPNFGKNIFPKLNPSDIKQIPIIKADEQQQQEITDMVNQILTTKAANSTADTSILEAQIDRLIYRLYGLTDDEIAIVEGGNL